MTTGSTRDLLSEWAKKIAVEVEPEREPLAPMMLEAYLRGGREQKQLFKNSPIPGAFLPEGGASLLPYAFSALSIVAVALKKFCAGEGLTLLSDVLSCCKNGFDLIQIIKPFKKEATMIDNNHEVLIILHRLLQKVQIALEKQGLPREQCELVIYRVMNVLAQQPVEAAHFLNTFVSEEA